MMYSDDPRIRFVPNGVTTSFPFPGLVLQADDLSIAWWGSMGEPLGLPPWTIAGVGDPDGCTVIFSEPPAAVTGSAAWMERRTDRVSTGNKPQDFVQESAAERELRQDQYLALAQEGYERDRRALQQHPMEAAADYVLPPPSERAMKLLGFDQAGTPRVFPIDTPPVVVPLWEEVVVGTGVAEVDTAAVQQAVARLAARGSPWLRLEGRVRLGWFDPVPFAYFGTHLDRPMYRSINVQGGNLYVYGRATITMERPAWVTDIANAGYFYVFATDDNLLPNTVRNITFDGITWDYEEDPAQPLPNGTYPGFLSGTEKIEIKNCKQIHTPTIGSVTITAVSDGTPRSQVAVISWPDGSPFAAGSSGIMRLDGPALPPEIPEGSTWFVRAVVRDEFGGTTCHISPNDVGSHLKIQPGTWGSIAAGTRFNGRWFYLLNSSDIWLHDCRHENGRQALYAHFISRFKLHDCSYLRHTEVDIDCFCENFDIYNLTFDSMWGEGQGIDGTTLRYGRLSGFKGRKVKQLLNVYPKPYANSGGYPWFHTHHLPKETVFVHGTPGQFVLKYAPANILGERIWFENLKRTPDGLPPGGVMRYKVYYIVSAVPVAAPSPPDIGPGPGMMVTVSETAGGPPIAITDPVETGLWQCHILPPRADDVLQNIDVVISDMEMTDSIVDEEFVIENEDEDPDKASAGVGANSLQIGIPRRTSDSPGARDQYKDGWPIMSVNVTLTDITIRGGNRLSVTELDGGLIQNIRMIDCTPGSAPDVGDFGFAVVISGSNFDERARQQSYVRADVRDVEVINSAGGGVRIALLKGDCTIDGVTVHGYNTTLQRAIERYGFYMPYITWHGGVITVGRIDATGGANGYEYLRYPGDPEAVPPIPTTWLPTGEISGCIDIYIQNNGPGAHGPDTKLNLVGPFNAHGTAANSRRLRLLDVDYLVAEGWRQTTLPGFATGTVAESYTTLFRNNSERALVVAAKLLNLEPIAASPTNNSRLQLQTRRAADPGRIVDVPIPIVVTPPAVQPPDPPCTLIAAGHGKTDGQQVYLTAENRPLPAPFALSTFYFVVNATADTLQLALTLGGAAIVVPNGPQLGGVYRIFTATVVPITVATPAVLTWPNSATVTFTIPAVTVPATPGRVGWPAHGRRNGQEISFSTTGALPTPAAANTSYYVCFRTDDDFEISTNVGGEVGLNGHGFTFTGTQSGVHTGYRIANGTRMYLGSTGALPTGPGFTALTTYFVVGKAGPAFSLALTLGGAAIATTVAGSGTHHAIVVATPQAASSNIEIDAGAVAEVTERHVPIDESADVTMLAPGDMLTSRVFKSGGSGSTTPPMLLRTLVVPYTNIDTTNVAAPWSPADLGAQLKGWFDAQRPETIVHAAGVVSSWTDIVTKLPFTQATEAAKPKYDGANVVFDGVDDYLRFTGLELGTWPRTTAFEIWAVAEFVGPFDPALPRVLFQHPDNAGGRFASLRNNTTGNLNAVCGDGVTSVSQLAGLWAAGKRIARLVHTGAGLFCEIDGVAGPTTAMGLPALTGQRNTIGADSQNTAARFWPGPVDSLLVTDRLSAADAGKLYDFLGKRL